LRGIHKTRPAFPEISGNPALKDFFANKAPRCVVFSTPLMLSQLLQPYLLREAEKPYSGEPFLFPILNHPDFGNDPVDIARLLLHRRSAAGRKGVESVPLLTLLENPLLLYSLGLARPENLLMTGKLLLEWAAEAKEGNFPEIHTLPLPALRDRERQSDLSAPVTISLPDEKFFKGYLRQLSISASTLNKFLRCPLQFYYENLLRVVSGEPVYFTFGKIMHTVLEKAFLARKENGIFPNEADLRSFLEAELDPFKGILPEEILTQQRERGQAILARYETEVFPTAHANAEIEYSVPRVLSERRIPLTGRIDKLEFYPGEAKVVDYKTGNPESAFRKAGRPSPESPLGGDYWRQMVFYKLLVEAETGQHGLVKKGAVEFLERAAGEPVREEFELSEEDAQTVRGQVRAVWKKLQAADFATGCGKENCPWCSLVRETGMGV